VVDFAGADAGDEGEAVRAFGVLGADFTASAANPTATAWAQRAPEERLSGQGQTVSRSVADLTLTVTRNGRLPDLTLPCQPPAPAFASTTEPASKMDFPSLKAFQEAAFLNVVSVHPVIRRQSSLLTPDSAMR
jgi:hypothetical protein